MELTNGLSLWDVGGVGEQVCHRVVAQSVGVVRGGLGPHLHSEVLGGHLHHVGVHGVVVLEHDAAAGE